MTRKDSSVQYFENMQRLSNLHESNVEIGSRLSSMMLISNSFPFSITYISHLALLVPSCSQKSSQASYNYTINGFVLHKRFRICRFLVKSAKYSLPTYYV